jgi:Uma2 family endonuclease
MASTTHIPVSDYLQTVFRPDREYIDGEIRERNVGKYEHARLQALLTAWFYQHESEWSTIVVTEQRVRVSATRVRVPDVALLPPGNHPEVISDPPMLVVEILSPDDTYSDTEDRARDYFAMGVSAVWILDPYTRTGRMCIGRTWTGAETLVVPDTLIHLELEQIYGRLDSNAAAS